MEASEQERRRAFPGKLVAVTATGPIYRVRHNAISISIASAVALLQELAARTEDPGAEVTSTLASRVSGDEAYRAWADISAQLAVSTANLPPSARIIVLDEVLRHVRKTGANGVESLLVSAVNSAWQYLHPQVMETTVRLTRSLVGRAKFADSYASFVCDATNRTIRMLPAGALKTVEVDLWIDEWRLGLAKGSMQGSNVDEQLGQFGLGAGTIPDWAGGTGPGLPGGHGTPGASDKTGEQLGQFGIGPRRFDFSQNGGPFGFGSILGPGGADKPPGPAEESAWGNIGLAAGAVILGAATVASGGTVLVVVAVGSAVFGAGAYLVVDAGRRADAQAEASGGQKAPDSPKPDEKKPDTPKKDETKPEEGKKDDPKKPRPGDSYPDPDGGGGKPDPTMLPDYEGGNGGNPLWLPSEDGGTPPDPTMLWDENGGGVGPVTLGSPIQVETLEGRGLLADVVLVGPQTFHF